MQANKVNRIIAVAFMKSLGFTKADGWSDEKLVEKLGQVPDKVTEKEVAPEYKNLYDQLRGDPEGRIEISGGAAAGEGGKIKNKAARPEARAAVKRAERSSPKGKEGKGKSVGLSAHIDYLISKGEKDPEVIYRRSKDKFPGGVGHAWTLKTVAHKLARRAAEKNEQKKKKV